LFLYRKASAIITVTHAFKRNLIDRGIDGGKIHVVTNGVDVSRFAPLPKDAALRAALGLEQCFVAGYIGTHGLAHGLGTLIDAANILANSAQGQAVRILMLGDGAHRADLEARAESEGLRNILFLGSVPRDEVTRYWSLLDVSIIHLKKSDLFRTVIPSKLFECMGMGIPVLHGVEGESADIVVEHGIGLTFEPENPRHLVEQLHRLHGERALRERFACNGVKAVVNYDRSVLAGNMLEILERTGRGSTNFRPAAPG
jgi:glycosyltransferase involved in cell wall biosynthesis